ncbi:hypothetical protein [Pedobacter sp. BMA]|uniref:hypothetical protein n=1 Tax=Pedobacter sp. BMA TaxID=1663685 RepID=UPI00064960B8|nr:hypothetical protein [Pedobacter sp. BMA]KLT66715.1 hypothetical protein AB669_06000 [Pedobacter sp. BMA]
MKTNHAIYVVFTAFTLIAAACTNYKPVKEDYYKDNEDTIKKDSLNPGKRVDVKDSIQKY